MKEESFKIMKEAYQCKNNEETLKMYDRIASVCQEVLLDGGYDAPNSIASLVNKYVLNKTYTILDVGCGTGLVAEYLRIYGFNNIHGLDALNKMIQICSSKKLYKKLYKLKIGQDKKEALNKKYKTVIGCGIFTKSHINPKYFEDLLYWVETKGLLVISVTDPVLKEIDEKIRKFKNEVSIVEKIHKESMTTNYKEGYSYKIFILEKQ